MSDNIQAPDPVQWDKYSDGGAGKPMPPKGEYSLLATNIEINRNSAGYLQFVVDATVQAPGAPHDGFLTRFNRFNTKSWPGKQASGASDYLAAHGIVGMTTDAEYETAAKATLGRPFKALLDWEIYDTKSGFSLKGYENFPTDKDGNKVSRVQHQGATLFANARIKYAKSAVAKAVA